jgi:hypothetical protein
MPQQRESDLDQILKGLQIAGSVYGLYTNSKDLELKKAQMDQLTAEKDAAKAEKARIAAGDWDGQDADKALASGGLVSDVEMPNAVKKSMILPSGEKKEVWWKTPAQVQAEAKADSDTKAGAIASEQKNFERDKYVAGEVDKFKQDDQVQEILKKSSASKSVGWLLKQKQPNLDAAALAAVFKMSGDVGAVRQEDRDNFGLSPALEAQAQATLKRLSEGQVIAPAERANLLKWTAMIDHVSKRDIQKLADQRASTIAKTSHKNRNEVLEMINPLGMLPEDFETATDEQISKTGNQNISTQSLPGESKALANPKNEDDDDFLKRYLNK